MSLLVGLPLIGYLWMQQSTRNGEISGSKSTVMKFIGHSKEYLLLENVDHTNCEVLVNTPESSLSAIWFESENNKLEVDGIEHSFEKNQIVFLTEFHKVKIKYVNQVKLLRFNRPFYCILDHDAEVGCKGILFFGASQLPIISIPEKDIETFKTLWKMFSIEMQSTDDLQMDMLQMMLKRYLILCTRIYKQQHKLDSKKEDLDLVREFNFLVEKHFKTHHSVAAYAELLNRSPKTLSNLFAQMGAKTPLQYIHDRKMIEARRMLHYSSDSIKEIAYELGFEDIQTFSRFFKRQEGISPSEYKGKKQ